MTSTTRRAVVATALFVGIGGLAALAAIEIDRAGAAPDDCNDTRTIEPGAPAPACAVPGPNLAVAGAVGVVAGGVAAGAWLVTAGRSTPADERGVDTTHTDPQEEE